MPRISASEYCPQKYFISDSRIEMPKCRTASGKAFAREARATANVQLVGSSRTWSSLYRPANSANRRPLGNMLGKITLCAWSRRVLSVCGLWTVSRSATIRWRRAMLSCDGCNCHSTAGALAVIAGACIVCLYSRPSPCLWTDCVVFWLSLFVCAVCYPCCGGMSLFCLSLVRGFD